MADDGPKVISLRPGSGGAAGDAGPLALCPSCAVELAACLEELLAQARAGEIVGMAVALYRADGRTTGEWIGSSSPDALAGMLGRLQHEIYADTR